ncbi:hypothetical protein Tco_1396460 [Tanacetum coccineum]
MFVGCCLTSWFSKKQTALAISTTKAEYVSAEKACQQALWMKQDLIDYDILLDYVLICVTTKTRKDYGTKRGCLSTSASSSSAFDHPSSSAFDHPSSSHYIDDDNDEDDEGTSCASTPSPTSYVNYLSNGIP